VVSIIYNEGRVDKAVRHCQIEPDHLARAAFIRVTIPEEQRASSDFFSSPSFFQLVSNNIEMFSWKYMNMDFNITYYATIG
jgi:hypothetical protein